MDKTFGKPLYSHHALHEKTRAKRAQLISIDPRYMLLKDLSYESKWSKNFYSQNTIFKEIMR